VSAGRLVSQQNNCVGSTPVLVLARDIGRVSNTWKVMFCTIEDESQFVSMEGMDTVPVSITLLIEVIVGLSEELKL
jgi:hypothetical protein